LQNAIRTTKALALPVETRRKNSGPILQNLHSVGTEEIIALSRQSNYQKEQEVFLR
jgi:hypothetical protein